MTLLNRLRERIAREGAISVAEYMELCNTQYYATRDPFGQQGDFTTAPEISQIFGELIGAWVAAAWQQLGCLETVLCEVGPGRGTLMKDVLRATRNVKQFHDSLRVHMVETSPTLEALQRQTLRGMHPRLQWQGGLGNLPSLPLLLVGNEFLDALPIRQEVLTPQGWQERRVKLNGEAFAFTPDGTEIRESCPAALAVIQQLGMHIKAHGGAALLVDYGYNTPAHGDTLQAVKRHSFHTSLETPGEADLTAHVDFGALMQQAEAMGLSTHYTTQGDFLRRLGAELRASALCQKATHETRITILQGLERLLSPEQMGELFKVLCITSLHEDVAGF